jgi:hypothetical protein
VSRKSHRALRVLRLLSSSSYPCCSVCLFLSVSSRALRQLFPFPSFTLSLLMISFTCLGVIATSISCCICSVRVGSVVPSGAVTVAALRYNQRLLLQIRAKLRML